ncbi:MAG: tetratricopeptide repeat protein [Endomicrobia bacterium]|nr:tetratricopeptide repeat protein [Endomicrobiia bacterium]
MKKPKPIITIAVGFIAGLAISGVLGDIIIVVNSAAGRVTSAWNVSRAEKYISADNFSEAVKEYEKALKKIRSGNKKLLAKIKNNMALCVFTQADKENNLEKIKESITMFAESLELYKELGDAESIKQVETNIEEARKVLE